LEILQRGVYKTSPQSYQYICAFLIAHPKEHGTNVHPKKLFCGRSTT
jgi:hypothetical protein